MSDTNPPAYRPRCMNLCCKSMMVYGEAFESDPEYQAGLTDFWCQLTQAERARRRRRLDGDLSRPAARLLPRVLGAPLSLAADPKTA